MDGLIGWASAPEKPAYLMTFLLTEERSRGSGRYTQVGGFSSPEARSMRFHHQHRHISLLFIAAIDVSTDEGGEGRKRRSYCEGYLSIRDADLRSHANELAGTGLPMAHLQMSIGRASMLMTRGRIGQVAPLYYDPGRRNCCLRPI